MTNLDDFDRSLSAFLTDGPTVAPEPPVIAAMAHARTAPRRRDPFAALRGDVMAPTRPDGVRSGLVFAVIALAIAGAAIALFGGGTPPVTPGPSSPIPSSGPPSGAPAPSASGSAPASVAPFSRDVPMLISAGQPLVVGVTDPTGQLVDVTSIQPGDGASVPPGSVLIEADPADPAALIVRWSGPPCDTRLAALVDPTAHRVTITVPTCAGDSTALDRILRLAFSTSVDATAWFGAIATDQPSTPPGAPATRVQLGTVGGRTVTADIVDRSGDLTGIDVVQADRQTPVEVLTITNLDPQTLLVAWPGSPCDTVHRIVIAPDFGVAIDRPICFGDAVPEFWAVRLSFDVPVDANRVDTALHSGDRASGLPAFAQLGPDSAGGTYAFSAYDASGRLSEIDVSLPVPPPADPGVAGYDLQRVSDTTGRLVWRAPACADDQVLRIDPPANAWTLDWKACADAPFVVRQVELTFDHLPDTTGITVTLGPRS